MNSSHFIESVRQQLNRTNWPSPNEAYIVAVSGGPDSVALLYAMRILRDEIPLNLRPQIIVVHFDHGLRGVASREDALFVRALAESWDFRFIMGEGKPDAGLSGSSETWARSVRHRFFREIREQETENAWLVLGHHQDDLVETVLINLGRGTGLAGMAAMPALDSERKIVRPMLEIKRNDIVNFCDSNNLSYRHDLSNEEPGTWRNELRLSVIPELEKIFGDTFSQHIYQSHAIFRTENDFMDKSVDLTFEQQVERILGDDDRLLYLLFSRSQYLDLHDALRRRLSHRMLTAWQTDATAITFETVWQLDQFIEQDDVDTMDLVGGLRVKKDADSVRLYHKKRLDDYEGRITIPLWNTSETSSERHTVYISEQSVKHDILTTEPSCFAVETIDIRLLKEPEKQYNSPYMIFADKQLSNSVFRTRRSGDQLLFHHAEQPFHKSLKKYMHERAIWSELRDKILLFADDELVYWIPGVVNAKIQTEHMTDNELTRICFIC